MRVLELGSGTGLLGLGIAASMANSRVLLTDPGLEFNYAEDNLGSTLERLRLNLLENAALTGGRASAAVLLWGNATHIADIAQRHEPFDLIVGSDLLYDEKQHVALLATLEALSGAATVVVLANPQRYATMHRFHEKAAVAFAVTTVDAAATAASRLPGNVNVTISELRPIAAPRFTTLAPGPCADLL